MSALDKLARCCGSELRGAWYTKPFSVSLDGKHWAAATDARCVVAVCTMAKADRDALGSVPEKHAATIAQLLAPTAGRRVPIAALRAWAGDGTPVLGTAEHGRIFGRLVDRVLFRAALALAPADGDAMVAIGDEMEPVRLQAPGWRCAVMPCDDPAAAPELANQVTA